MPRLSKDGSRTGVFLKKDVRTLAFFVVAMFCIPNALSAQSNGAPNRLVAVKVSATDRAGSFVANLSQSVFKVFDDGVEQTLTEFRTEEVPVSLGFVIDNSASIGNKREAISAVAATVISSFNPLSEAFITFFNDDAYLDQPFTSDKQKLAQALEKMDSRGGTAMRDAVSMSIDYVKARAKNERRVLVVVTDGDDNVSTGTLEQLIRKTQAADVQVYTIGLLNEEEPRRAINARRALKEIAEASGGLAYYPNDTAELGRLSPLVAQVIQNQYVLGFSASNSVTGSRNIRVTVTTAAEPTARIRILNSPPSAVAK